VLPTAVPLIQLVLVDCPKDVRKVPSLFLSEMRVAPSRVSHRGGPIILAVGDSAIYQISVIIAEFEWKTPKDAEKPPIE